MIRWKFTHKEFSLLLGIVVAIIIIVTLWLRPIDMSHVDATQKSIPIGFKPAAKLLIEKAAVAVFKSF